MSNNAGLMVPAAPPRRQTRQSRSGWSSKDYVEPRFEYVVLGPRKDRIICKLDTGALYELPMTALECAEGWDGTAARRAGVVENGRGVAVDFASGARVDFAADLVLCHCEPRYPWTKQHGGTRRIGERIRCLREAARMSLENLSRKTGIAVPNLSRLEHGKHTPMIATLQKVAHALGVAPLEIVRDARQPAAGQARTSHSRTAS
jgi:DNA-binding Xre family transcriptional regulator